MTASASDLYAPEIARIGGRRVLFVMAAAAEYGPHLRRRIRPLMTGVGPIEAAVETSLALSALARGWSDGAGLPDLVVSLGSAGSRLLEQGAVYAAASVSWRDVDASPLGFTKGVTPFLDHPVHVPLTRPVALMPAVRLSTGADIVSGAAYDGVDAEMVDMETFAVMRACRRFGVPLAGFRGISDGAGELHHYDDWTTLLHVVDENLAETVDRLAEALAAGAPLDAPA